MSFTGEVAAHYARHRRGFPPAAVDLLVDALGLPRSSTVLDLGCGTGQLTVPLAGRYDRVIGVDPSPDMLDLARSAGVPSITWLLGSDTDLPDLSGLDAVTVANAIHLMDAPALIRRLAGRARLAIIANGTPLWRHDTAWSRALRAVLEDWMGTALTSYCGLDPASRASYRAEMEAAGFATDEVHLDYTDSLTADQVIGNVYSAMSPSRLPHGADRVAFERRLHDALGAGPLTEPVRVAVLTGRPA